MRAAWWLVGFALVSWPKLASACTSYAERIVIGFSPDARTVVTRLEEEEMESTFEIHIEVHELPAFELRKRYTVLAPTEAQAWAAELAKRCPSCGGNMVEHLRKDPALQRRRAQRWAEIEKELLGQGFQIDAQYPPLPNAKATGSAPAFLVPVLGAELREKDSVAPDLDSPASDLVLAFGGTDKVVLSKISTSMSAMGDNWFSRAYLDPKGAQVLLVRRGACGQTSRVEVVALAKLRELMGPGPR